MDILRQQTIRRLLGKPAKQTPRAKYLLAQWLFDATLEGHPVANYLLNKRLGYQ